MINVRGLTSFQLDTLKEVSNIGAGHSATALSKLIAKEIVVKTPCLTILSLKESKNIIKDPKALLVGIYFGLREGLDGNVFLVFPLNSALCLLNILKGKKEKSTKNLSPSDKSILKEIGTILTCSYLNVISQMIGSPLVPSAPGLACDIGETIIEFAFIQLGQVTENVLVIESAFIDSLQKIKGEFMLFLSPSLVEAMLEALRVNNI